MFAQEPPDQCFQHTAHREADTAFRLAVIALTGTTEARQSALAELANNSHFEVTDENCTN